MSFLSCMPLYLLYILNNYWPFFFWTEVKVRKWKLLSPVHDSLQPHGLYSPWNSPGQNTGVSSLSLLQGIFPTQGLKPGLSHCRWILYQLSHMGSPRILEWVADPFSSRSSQPRNRTSVSCIAGRFFTDWATREVKFHILLDGMLFPQYILAIFHDIQRSFSPQYRHIIFV